MPLFGLALLAQPALAEEWSNGETIDKAAYADLTPEGLNAIAALIPALLPADLAIPDTSDSGGEPDWCLGYEYALSGASVDVEVVNATITPGSGVLDVTANLLVSLNDASNPFQLSYEALCVGETCDGYVDPFAVTVTTTMALEVVEAGGVATLDATVGAINVSYALDNGDIHFDCAIGDIEGVLNWFGLSLYDLIIGQLDGYLQDAIADMGPTLEETIEDAFSSASISQELELNGAVATLSLQPSDVEITTDGVRVQMSGSMEAEAAECVAAYDPGGSLKTPTQPPALGATPSGVGSDYHVALTLSDDFMNQALYALWRGGLLCYTVEPGGDIPLDTSILNLLSGDAFVELFPESQPISLQTAPKAPPTTKFDGSHAIDMNLRALGLQFYAELDGREAKMLTVDLEGTVGADLAFDATTGALGIEVDLDPSALTPSVGYNEFYPEANETILAGFSSAFGSIVDTVVGGLLEGLEFALPAFNGIGLLDLQTAPVGDDADWLGAYAWVGPVTYEAADGCGADGGCSSEGCSGGCMSGPGGPAFWAAFAGLFLLRRRK